MSASRHPGFRWLLWAVLAMVAAACGNTETDTTQPPEPNGGTETTEAQAGPVPVTILYSRAAEQLSLWAAEEQGFFEEHGIDATLEEIPGASQVPVAISGGSAEMGFQTGPDFLNAVEQGIELSIISGLSVDTPQNPRVALIAGKDSGITRPADVAGKRIAVPSLNSSTDLSTTHLLNQEGVETGSIDWVEVPFQQMADAINSGRVDAAVAVHPFIGQLLAQGHTPVIEKYATDDLPMLVVFLSADREWAEANPDAVDGIRAALEDANDFVEANPEEARAIMQQYSGLPAEIIERIPFPNLTTEVQPEQLDFFVEVMSDQGLISGDIDTESLIYP